MFVCLFVCMCVRSHISITTCPNFTKYSVRVVGGCGSKLIWRQYNTLCTSGFVDDVMFWHNTAKGPESKTTQKFCPVRQVVAPTVKSSVSDCIWLKCCCWGAYKHYFQPNARQVGCRLMYYTMLRHFILLSRRAHEWSHRRQLYIDMSTASDSEDHFQAH